MFSITKATVKDINLINALASEIWEPTYGEILSKDQLDYMFIMMYSPENILRQMEEKHHIYFIIWKDKEPAGYLSVEKLDSDLFEFQKIYSLPNLHGTGIGRFIIEQGIKWIRSIHPAPFKVQLNVNRSNPAVGFYNHMGFKEHSTRDFHIGNGYYMNDYVMHLDVE